MRAVRLKRAYEEPETSDGVRVLVDRLWPRGVSKERLHIELWAKDVAPSNALRRWFGHDPERWTEFRKRYVAELRAAAPQAEIERIKAAAKRAATLTLVYGAKDERHNNAVVLQALLSRHATGRRS